MFIECLYNIQYSCKHLHFILLSQQAYMKALFDVYFTDNVTKSELLLEYLGSYK